jgi:hypothetical protein
MTKESFHEVALADVDWVGALGGFVEMGTRHVGDGVNLEMSIPIGHGVLFGGGPWSESIALIVFEKTSAANEVLHVFTDPVVADTFVVIVHVSVRSDVRVETVTAECFNVVIVTEECGSGVAAVGEGVEACVVSPLDNTFLEHEVLVVGFVWSTVSLTTGTMISNFSSDCILVSCVLSIEAIVDAGVVCVVVTLLGQTRPGFFAQVF